jgi:RimJ/RimL family protein N-acetyltransferase
MGSGAQPVLRRKSRQGIAGVMAAAFISLCRESHKIPHWDCWKNNLPSVKTAEKMSFEKLADYEVLFLSFV